jgi:N-acetylglucosaminyl-diphospho-decaprenol L-rhamnosyltransferase
MLIPEVSIIVVNWHSKEYLRQCLHSITRDDQLPPSEIIVVDNASYDGCDRLLTTEFKNVKFIQCEKNLGFARANNLGFSHAKGEFILFLNPDTETRPGAVRAMWENLRQLAMAGVVGGHLLNSDGSIQTTSVRAFPTIVNQLLDTDLLRKFRPHSSLWGIMPLCDSKQKPEEVEAVSGACMMVKKSVFESISMFSTDYFMYSEDIDLCFKVRGMGFKTYYIPTAVVVHHGGTSSAQSSINTFSSVMILESRVRFFRKTRDRWYALLYRFGILLSSLLRILMVLLCLPAFVSCQGRPVANMVLAKWAARLRWSLGLERWVKGY